MKWYMSILIKLTQMLVKILFNWADTNKDGNISKEEFNDSLDLILTKLNIIKKFLKQKV